MPPFLQLFKDVDLNTCTLIIPSISVGNIPQLTIDLIIKTLDLNKIGSIWHPSIISSVGADPYEFNSSKICSACELYLSEKLKIACIQLRSTLDSKTANKFFDDISDCISSMNFKQVIILSSAFDYELRTIKKESYYFLSNLEDNLLIEHDIKKLEKNEYGKYYLSGAGFALNLYLVLSKKINCILFGKYISEGDNRPDAQSVFKTLFHLLNVEETLKTIEYPSSWDLVFGGPPPVGIF